MLQITRDVTERIEREVLNNHGLLESVNAIYERDGILEVQATVHPRIIDAPGRFDFGTTKLVTLNI